MASPGFQESKRSWQEIAAEASVEKDPQKLQRLADEMESSRGTRRVGKSKVGLNAWSCKNGRKCLGGIYPRPATPPPSQ
jgi:hypothetical protein